MDTLDGIKAVVAVIETGSFTAAAERLDISKALVSKYVSQVESELQVRLFNRTTRKISITQAGEHYYVHALGLLSGFESLVDQVKSNQNQVKGTLKVTTSLTFSEELLTPLIPEFLSLFPDIELDLIVTNEKLDLLEQGIDLALRIGELKDSSLCYKRLASLSYSYYAAPELFEKLQVQNQAHNLNQLPYLKDTNITSTLPWDKESNDETDLKAVNPMAFKSNNPRVIRSLALAGIGFTLIPDIIAEKFVQAGKLIKLNSGLESKVSHFNAVYPHRVYLPEKTKCFIEFIEKRIDKTGRLIKNHQI